MSNWRNKGEMKEIPKIKQKWKHNLPEPLRHSKSSAEREAYSYEHLY
jgi:hypothetical protein